MKPYVFGIGSLLMLVFCCAGIHALVAAALCRLSVRQPHGIAFAFDLTGLVVLVSALAWSVPPRG
ncbi:hypothetical protein C7H84_18985 [Burkholderia sp. Nafp2/4-1b]|uniref:hypothetical protein n=1 Tax=Burkholderia sp. Nafp2/4-1b TaxID=2116686 RepID=UPI000EF96AF7|nr:hypothetical protein [Burkholderia sp. Nafp2/4-1b]RKU01803.1 hypothetical protein C7H84_18985 [Burkholderia sp. Nafp2/4-1b]